MHLWYLYVSVSRKDLFLHVDEDHTRACLEEVQTFNKHGHTYNEENLRRDNGELGRL